MDRGGIRSGLAGSDGLGHSPSLPFLQYIVEGTLAELRSSEKKGGPEEAVGAYDSGPP